MTDWKGRQNDPMKVIICMMLISVSFSLNAQNLDDYQWKQRLIIVYTDDLQSETYKQQIYDLQSDLAGLQERKLIVYHVHKEQFRIGFDDDTSWHDIEQKDFWARAQKFKNGFHVELIGLDGGEKFENSAILSCEDLFALIDGMPMRKAEIRKKTKND